MKKKIFSIVRTLLAGAAIVTLVSCNNIDDSAENTPDKKTPVLRVSIADDARTVLPDYDFSGFKFELTVAQEGGNQSLGNYTSKAELENAVINLEEKGLSTGSKYTFHLTATKKDNENISCSAECSHTLTEGDNVLKMKLYADKLGSDGSTGPLDYTLDYSKATNADSVTCITVRLAGFGDYVWENVWDNNDKDKDSVPENKKISIKEELKSGNYEIEICLYTTNYAELLHWNESVIIAEGLTSTKVNKISTLNEAYTVTFNMNYEGSQNVEVKAGRNTDFIAIIPKLKFPSRLGHAISGWYKESKCINKIDKNTLITESFTAYAKWEDVCISEAAVYDTNSMYIARGNYTITTFTEETQGAWYKLTTVKDSDYKINWCDEFGHNKTHYNEVPANLADAILYVYDSEGQPLTFDQAIFDDNDIPENNYADEDGKEYLDVVVGGTFKAKGSVTYIYVRPFDNEVDNIGSCAFRVMKANASSSNTLSAVVTSEQKDIELIIEENKNGSIIFKIPSEWISDNRQWYVDDVHVVNPAETDEDDEDDYTFTFEPSKYKRGTHLLSLEIEKDGKYYSYSAQIKVQ